MKESFGFTGGPEQFFYLSQSGVSTVSGVDDRKEFEVVQGAMTTIGITAEEQWAIWQILGDRFNVSLLLHGCLIMALCSMG
jgi:myosin heavy subunit